MNPTVRAPAASGNSCACAVVRTWALYASVTQVRHWADRWNETTAHRWTDRWSPWCVSARSGASVKDYPGRGYRLLVDGLPADGPWSDLESPFTGVLAASLPVTRRFAPRRRIQMAAMRAARQSERRLVSEASVLVRCRLPFLGNTAPVS